MPKAKSGPKFTHTARNQVGVFVQIGSGLESAHFCRVIEAMKIEHLAVRDFLEHSANVIAICSPGLFEPFQTIRQRI
jgi:hypothetical protein